VLIQPVLACNTSELFVWKTLG